jgi:hypothetical protein
LQASPRLRPFDGYLDEARALPLLREATAGADDGELFLERRRSEALAFDDGRLKTASYDAAEGFGLRAEMRVPGSGIPIEPSLFLPETGLAVALGEVSDRP